MMINTDIKWMMNNTDDDSDIELLIHDESHNVFDYVLNRHITNPTSVFYVCDDDNIKELPNIISTFTDIKKLHITNCSLLSVSNLPPQVEEIDLEHNQINEITCADIPNTAYKLDLNNNNLQKLNLLSQDNIRYIDISYNPIKELKLPINIIELNLSSTGIRTTEFINSLNNLQKLHLDNTEITDIDNLPDSIEELNISRTNLNINGGVINKLPSSLNKFVAHYAHIRRFAFDKFPNNLTVFDVFRNELTEMPEFPDVMTEIDISENNLIRITNIPKTIKQFDSRMNENLVFTDEQKNIISILKTTPWDIYVDTDTDDDISMLEYKNESDILLDSMMNMQKENENFMINMDREFIPSKRSTNKIKHHNIYPV